MLQTKQLLNKKVYSKYKFYDKPIITHGEIFVFVYNLITAIFEQQIFKNENVNILFEPQRIKIKPDIIFANRSKEKLYLVIEVMTYKNEKNRIKQNIIQIYNYMIGSKSNQWSYNECFTVIFPKN